MFIIYLKLLYMFFLKIFKIYINIYLKNFETLDEKFRSKL